MKQVISKLKNERGTTQVFWGEISPCDHAVQIYQLDDEFLDALEEFVCGGFANNEAVVVIATPQHVQGLERRLRSRGFDLNELALNDRYIALDAERTLSRFMQDGWPNEDLFRSTILQVLDRARQNGRLVRAFGEMVAVLWSNGHNAATVRLEHLWNHLCAEETFPLFCAYPRIGFTDKALKSLDLILDAHHRVVERAAA